MFKKVLNTILLILIAKSFAFSQCNQKLVDYCTSKLNDDTKYIREYRAKLGQSKTEEIPVARYSVLLTKGNTYRFNICSALDYEGDGIIQLYDGNKIVASSYHAPSKTTFDIVEFECNKTAIYKLYISFKDGKRGCSVGVLSLVE